MLQKQKEWGSSYRFKTRQINPKQRSMYYSMFLQHCAEIKKELTQSSAFVQFVPTWHDNMPHTNGEHCHKCPPNRNRPLHSLSWPKWSAIRLWCVPGPFPQGSLGPITGSFIVFFECPALIFNNGEIWEEEHTIMLTPLTIKYFHMVEGVPEGFVVMSATRGNPLGEFHQKAKEQHPYFLLQPHFTLHVLMTIHTLLQGDSTVIPLNNV